MAKTQQPQIRVTPQEKAALKRQAGRAGQDVSAYVLARVLRADTERFCALLHALGQERDRRYALAELNEFLSALAPVEFADAVADADPGRLALNVRNYVAAMVEQAAGQKGVSAPRWTREVVPPSRPEA